MKNSHSDVRHHILDVSKPIILNKSFSAVGLSEVLAAAQVPKGSFYYYFRSKEAFGEALLEDYFLDYLCRLDALFGLQDVPAADRLMRLWARWVETQTGDDVDCKCLAVKLGAEVSDLSEAMRNTLERGTSDIVKRIAACIREGLADGSLHNIADSEHTALVLYELWVGATVMSKLRRDSSAFEGAMGATRKLLNLPSAETA